MNRIEHQDFIEAEKWWNKYGIIEGTEVIEIIDYTTGKRSILIKETK